MPYNLVILDKFDRLVRLGWFSVDNGPWRRLSRINYGTTFETGGQSFDLPSVDSIEVIAYELGRKCAVAFGIQFWKTVAEETGTRIGQIRSLSRRKDLREIIGTVRVTFGMQHEWPVSELKGNKIIVRHEFGIMCRDDSGLLTPSDGEAP